MKIPRTKADKSSVPAKPMTNESKVLIQEVTRVLKDIKSTGTSGDVEKIAATVAEEVDLRLAGIENQVALHFKIGGAVVSGFVVILGGIFSWLLAVELPKDLSATKTESTALVSERLHPIEIRLAVLTAMVELSKTNTARNIPKILEDNAADIGTSDLKAATIQAVADLATQEKVEAPPAQIRSIATEILNANPDPTLRVWSAVESLARYASMLVGSEAPLPPKGAPVFPVTNLPLVVLDDYGAFSISFWGTRKDRNRVPFLARAADFDTAFERLNKLSGGLVPDWMILDAKSHRFHLDGIGARKVIFMNAVVVYNGGETMLDEVYFVNCQFEISRSSRGVTFAKSIFKAPSQTVDIGIEGS